MLPAWTPLKIASAVSVRKLCSIMLSSFQIISKNDCEKSPSITKILPLQLNNHILSNLQHEILSILSTKLICFHNDNGHQLVALIQYNTNPIFHVWRIWFLYINSIVLHAPEPCTKPRGKITAPFDTCSLCVSGISVSHSGRWPDIVVLGVDQARRIRFRNTTVSGEIICCRQRPQGSLLRPTHLFVDFFIHYYIVGYIGSLAQNYHNSSS